MPKTETTSKMSLKLTSRINLGRWGARGLSFRLWTQPTRPIPTAWKGLNPTRRCNTDVKSCAHHPYHCLPPQNERFAPLSIVKNIDNKLLDYSDLLPTQIHLFGDTSPYANTNLSTLNATIDFAISFEIWRTTFLDCQSFLQWSY